MKPLIDLVEGIVGNRQTAAKVIEALVDEGAVTFKSRGDAGVDAVLSTFKRAFGTTRSTRYDRFAAKRLIDSHGVDGVTTVIKLLRQHLQEQYCPTVNSVRELEDKWVSVGRFLQALVEEDNIEV